MNLNSIGASISTAVVRGKMSVEKNSPEILLVGGIFTILGGTYLACRATLKFQDLIDEHEDIVDKMEKTREYAEAGKLKEGKTYTEEEHMQDLVAETVKFAMRLVKLYGPAVITSAVGIAMLVYGNRILNARNAALVSAYATLKGAYDAYRKRVIKEFGEEVDTYIRFRKPLDKDFVIKEDKKGGKEIDFDEAELPGEIYDVDGVGEFYGRSPYARLWDSTSPQWRHDTGSNHFFLKVAEREMNDKLHARGTLMLNEVFDMLGLERTSAGCVVGWTSDDIGGDGFVNIGIDHPINDWDNHSPEGNPVILDFNVDGLVYEKV